MYKQHSCLKVLLNQKAPAISENGSSLVSIALQTNNFDILSVFIDPELNALNDTLQKTLVAESKKLCPVRVTLLGAPAAGKTTLVNLISQHIQNISGDFPSSNLATDGIDISPLGSFEFWDFGGQETLFTTHQFFLAEEVQYVIVTDCSALLSSDPKIREIAVSETKYCMSLAKAWTLTRTSAPVILVGTRFDLLSSKTEKQNAITFLNSLAQSEKLSVPKIFTISNKRKKYRKQIALLIDLLKSQAEEFILSARGLTPDSYQNYNMTHTIQLNDWNLLMTKIEKSRSKEQFHFHLLPLSHSNHNLQETLSR